MDDLRGKVAVVTGGGSGIGRGIAEALADAGARLIIADIEGLAAEAVAALIRDAGHPAIARRTDVTDGGDLESLAEATIEAFGSVHMLVNNAGVMTLGPLDEATEADWSWLFEVNVHGMVRGVRAFLPQLRANAPAHIVNTISMASLGPRLDGEMGIYTASKGAALGFTEVLRAELAGDGIGVTAVCPGPVSTRLYEAERNRHERFGAGRGMDTPARAHRQQPDEVGAMVVDAIRRNAGYVFTDLDSRGRIEERAARINEGLDYLEQSSA